MLTVTAFNKLRTSTTFNALLRYNVSALHRAPNSVFFSKKREILHAIIGAVSASTTHHDLLRAYLTRKLGTVNQGLAHMVSVGKITVGGYTKTVNPILQGLVKTGI